MHHTWGRRRDGRKAARDGHVQGRADEEVVQLQNQDHAAVHGEQAVSSWHTDLGHAAHLLGNVSRRPILRSWIQVADQHSRSGGTSAFFAVVLICHHDSRSSPTHHQLVLRGYP